jgi:4a-hydroxytetrahydrobiopterin dehydratase
MPVLGDEEISERLAAHVGWSAAEGASIARDFKFPNFRAAMAFVNLVADAAEQQNHHPDILIHGWNKVRLTLSTHSEGGVTDADFQLAGRIDRLA